MKENGKVQWFKHLVVPADQGFNGALLDKNQSFHYMYFHVIGWRGLWSHMTSA